MKSTKQLLLAITCLALVALSCQAFTPRGNEAPEANETPLAGNVLFVDDFSEVAWGTGTDEKSSIEYANETLQMVLFAPNHFVWSTPGDTEYENVHIEVTVINNNSDPTTAFGLMCHMQSEPDSFYFFGVTPAGQYAIVKAASELPTDVFLTNDNQWGYSELITPNATSYSIGADCGNGTLTLYVGGQPVDSVIDTEYAAGGVGLFAWSGEEAASADVMFDDFIITRLEQ